jgi:hypothetical protein
MRKSIADMTLAEVRAQDLRKNGGERRFELLAKSHSECVGGGFRRETQRFPSQMRHVATLRDCRVRGNLLVFWRW